MESRGEFTSLPKTQGADQIVIKITSDLVDAGAHGDDRDYSSSIHVNVKKSEETGGERTQKRRKESRRGRQSNARDRGKLKTGKGKV